MARNKTEVLTIRTTEEIKTLLKAVADREHRSLTSMLEVLVINYATQAGFSPPTQLQKASKPRR